MCACYFLLLSGLGLAITAQAQDCSRPVAGPNMSLKDSDILLQTFPDGTRVTFACDIGYVSAGGSPAITCTSGTWSPVKLKCERFNCGSAGEVSNGQVDYPEGTEFGDKLVVTCNSGFRLVRDRQILCGAQGWMNRLPECEVVTCNQPAPVANGSFSQMKDSYDYREVIQYTCRKDFTLIGTKSSSCSNNGTFTPAPPKCIMVECKDPDIDDADWVGGSRPPHGHLATVTFKCRTGFTMIGSPTQTCGINNQWAPGLPSCIRLSTTTKPTTTTTTTTSPSPKKPTADPGSTDSPGSGGNGRTIGLGIGLTILIVSVLTICGCYFCGVPAIIKEKRRSRRGLPDNVVPKDGEEVALS